MYARPVIVRFGKVLGLTFGTNRNKCPDPEFQKSSGGPSHTDQYNKTSCVY